MHRQQQDLPSGGQGQFGRGGVRRQLSRRDATRDGAQVNAWRILVRVLRARYAIPLDHVYALNRIDFKDARYCEGRALATMAREWAEKLRSQHAVHLKSVAP